MVEGDDEMKIRVTLAGITIELDVADGRLSELLSGRWKGFITAEMPSISLTVTSEEMSEGRQSERTDDMTFDGRLFSSNIRLSECTADFKTKKGKIILAGTEAEIWSSMERFITGLFSILLIEKNMLLMHAAALQRDGKAYVFSGPPDSGKTTVAEKDMRNLLCDEAVVLKSTESGLMTIPTMFSGNYPAKISQEMPLGNIYFIRHGSGLKAERLPVAESFYNIILNSFAFMLFGKGSAYVFSALMRKVPYFSSFPCFALESRKEDRIGEMIS